MKILVIGGSGFLSGTAAERYSTQGHKVWALTRGSKPLPTSVTGLIADRHDSAAFENAIAGAGTEWDLVVDCIAFEPEDINQDVEVLQHHCRHLVFVSTDFVYSPTHRHFPQSENGAVYATAGYGGGKRQAEIALENAQTGAMTWTVLRPGHIYGPRSLVGCLPLHSRDADLIATLKAGRPLRLAGGGHFLQQPVLARDLADLILSCAGNDRACGEIFNGCGPDVVESREYYRIIADILAVEMKVEEVPVHDVLAATPEAAPFLCHRCYDLTRLHGAGLRVPATPLAVGLREHIEWLLAQT